MKLRHVQHRTFDKLKCAISIICLAVVLDLVLVLKDSLRTYFKSLSLSLGVRSLSLSLRGSGPGGPCPCPGSWGSGPCPGPWGQVLVNIPELHAGVLPTTPLTQLHYVVAVETSWIARVFA